MRKQVVVFLNRVEVETLYNMMKDQPDKDNGFGIFCPCQVGLTFIDQSIATQILANVQGSKEVRDISDYETPA